MNIVVTSRREMENMVFDHPCVVISISEPGTAEASIKGNNMVQDILRLQFHDTGDDGKIQGFGGDVEPTVLQEMTLEQGREVVDFVEKWKDRVGTIYVHCHAGMSRSPGAAVAICQILRQRSGQFYGNGRFPNRHVAWTISTAWRNKKHGAAIHLLAPNSLTGPLCGGDAQTTNLDEALVTCPRCKSIIQTADGMQRAFDDFGRPEPALEGKCAVIEVKEEETDGRKAC